MNKQAELLRELVSSRQYLFTMLADNATEQGDEYIGKAWLWLRDHNKWPSPARRRQKWGGMRSGFSWCITTKANTLAEAEKKGPSVLPYSVVRKYYSSMTANEVYTSEESAFHAAVEQISRLIRWKEQEEARRKKEQEENSQQVS